MGSTTVGATKERIEVLKGVIMLFIHSFIVPYLR
jgi:hypothetical protein